MRARAMILVTAFTPRRVGLRSAAHYIGKSDAISLATAISITAIKNDK